MCKEKFSSLISLTCSLMQGLFLKANTETVEEMQGCIHKTERPNLLLMAPTQDWGGPEQIPAIEGTLNLPHDLNLPYSTTGKLWGALLYLSPFLMYPSNNSKQLLLSDFWLLYFNGQEKYFEKLSVILKILLRTFTAKYNINPSLMVKTLVSTCDSTQMCITQWDFTHNSWVRRKMLLPMCQKKSHQYDTNNKCIEIN